jgi:hypothetical protein
MKNLSCEVSKLKYGGRVQNLRVVFLNCFFSSFYKNGNFVAAINAFTAAIVLDGSIPSYPFKQTTSKRRLCFSLVN